MSIKNFFKKVVFIEVLYQFTANFDQVVPHQICYDKLPVTFIEGN